MADLHLSGADAKTLSTDVNLSVTPHANELSPIDNKTQCRQNPSSAELIAFSAPTLAIFFIMIPLQSILPGIYAKYFGLELTAIASVLLVSRLFDGISDPIVGYFCDRHRATGGSRKSWVIAGSLLVLVSAYYLYSPPLDVSVTYYLAWSVVIYLGWTIADIPHNAWGFELTNDYHQRAKVFSYRTTGIFLGICCFYALPMLPGFKSSSGEYTPKMLQTAVFIGLALMLVALTYHYFKAPPGHFIKSQQQDSARALLHSIIHNKPLLIFLVTYSAFAFSFGMWGALSFMYLDGYLNLGDKVATIFLAGSVAALGAIPFATILIKFSGKQVAWAISMLLYSVMLSGYWFLRPETHWALPLLLSSGAYGVIALHTVISASMLGDIVDYSEMKFHHNRGAVYSAILVFLFKLVSALSGALGIATLGYFGFVATAHLQSDSAVVGLKVGVVIIPLAFAFLATAITFLNPISKHRHHIIRKKIQQRSNQP